MSTQTFTEMIRQASRMMKKATLEQKVEIMIKANLIPPDRIEAVRAKARSIDAEEVEKTHVKKQISRSSATGGAGS